MKYLFLLMVANTLWAGSYAVMKWGVAEVDPLALVFYRMTVSAVVLWPIALIFFRDQLKKIDRIFVWRMLIVVSLDLIYQSGTCLGLRYTSAVDASLIISMEPVFLFLMASLVLRETITARHLISIGFAITGFMILSGFSEYGNMSFGNSALIGNVIIFLAVLGESGFSVFFQPLAARYSPVLLMTFVTSLQSITLGTFGVLSRPSVLIMPLTMKTFAVIGYLALFCSVFGYLVWLHVMKKVPVNTMAISLFLQPAFGPVIAAITLGESITVRVVFGGVAILASLYIVTVRERAAKVVPNVSECQ